MGWRTGWRCRKNKKEEVVSPSPQAAAPPWAGGKSGPSGAGM
jgi:hypothetical protein